MKKLILLAVLFSLISCYHSFSQDSTQDSLKNIIASSENSEEKVDAMIDLAITYRGSEPQELIRLSEDARDLAEEMNYTAGLANAYKWIGMGYFDQNQYIDVYPNWMEAQRLYNQIGDKAGEANIISNLGTVFNNQGDDEQALELYLRARTLAEEVEDKRRILTVSLNIGLIYQKKPETLDKALEFYLEALNLAEELEYDDGIGTASVNIGEVYVEKEEYSLALEYFEKSRKMLQGSVYLPYTLMNIGKLLTKQENFDEARAVLQEVYQLGENINSKMYQAQALIAIADINLKQGNTEKAITNLRSAEILSDEIDSKELLKQTYTALAKNSASIEDYKNAYHYQEKLTIVNDSLFAVANAKRLGLMLMTADLEKKQREVEVQELTIQKQKLAKNAFLVGLLFILVIAFIIFRNYLAKVKINKILDKQKEQIETLLLNILPKKVAKELQDHGKATPRDYESVSVLFTDFKGFSSIAKTLDPNELVTELSSFFVAFDNIAEKYNLEKIKTIGDAYMAAGGIPTPNDTHPLDTVRAGLEMQKFMRENNVRRAAEGKAPWELRVGIHTGPIVAGVVGKKKYAYDIWGSTVNIASRMESNGEAGKVNVSQTTYHLIDNNFTFKHRGKIMAKNVGEIDMYFVEEQKN